MSNLSLWGGNPCVTTLFDLPSFLVLSNSHFNVLLSSWGSYGWEWSVARLSVLAHMHTPLADWPHVGNQTTIAILSIWGFTLTQGRTGGGRLTFLMHGVNVFASTIAGLWRIGVGFFCCWWTVVFHICWSCPFPSCSDWWRIGAFPILYLRNFLHRLRWGTVCCGLLDVGWSLISTSVGWVFPCLC